MLGDRITDKEVIKKILHSVPEHLDLVAILIETLLDLNSMSIEEATGQTEEEGAPTPARLGASSM